MLNTYSRRYICTGLSASPAILQKLLQGATETELDTQYDADRFTLREVMAHLADWEPIWHERIRRTATEHLPHLPSYDEGQFAIDHDYGHSDFAAQMRHFAEGRKALVALLADLPFADWNRVGLRDEVGEVTILELAAMILGHDGYHAQQILDYRERTS